MPYVFAYVMMRDCLVNTMLAILEVGASKDKIKNIVPAPGRAPEHKCQQPIKCYHGMEACQSLPHSFQLFECYSPRAI
jgi:hypothetical protein